MLSKFEGSFLRISLLCATLGLLVGGLFPVYGRAQNPLDEVHVSPQSELRAPALQAEAEVSDGSLNTHTKPIKVDVNLVLVPVTVSDPQERLVVGLDRKDFEVMEGKNRQEIRHFSSEDAPVSLGVIFDMSGSMKSKIERAREAVIEFLKTLQVLPPGTRERIVDEHYQARPWPPQPHAQDHLSAEHTP